MFDEEQEPCHQPAKLKNLENMSFDELADYIQNMKNEISRVEEEIKRKKAGMDAASSAFKS